MKKKGIKFLGIFLVGLFVVSMFNGCIGGEEKNNDLFSKKLVYDNFPTRSLCVDDIDNDGYLDIIQAVVIPSDLDIPTGKVIIFINKNGNFEEAWNSDIFAPASLSLGDINNDRSEDIIAGAGQIFTYMNIGNNQFEKGWISDFREFQVYSIFSSDLNGDGYSDIVYGGNNDLKIHVLINKNGKEFTETWSKDLGELYYAVSTIFLDDVNNDSFKDIVCGTDDQKLYVFANLGDGNFSQLWTTELNFPAKSIYLKDLDNDGYCDLIIGSDGVKIFANDGGKGFELVKTYKFEFSIDSVYSNDVNNDNYNDILIGEIHSAYLLVNKGDFEFEEIWTYTPEENKNYINSVFLEDLDKDGYPDIIIGGSKLCVFINNKKMEEI